MAFDLHTFLMINDGPMTDEFAHQICLNQWMSEKHFLIQLIYLILDF